MPDLTTQLAPQIIAWGIAAVLLGLIVWKGWPAFRKVVGILSRGIKLVDTLATLPDDLAAIRHELEHNGGGSTKDAVVRTERAVAELAERTERRHAELAEQVAHVQRQAASLKTTVRKTNRKLDDHIKLTRTPAASGGSSREGGSHG